MTVVRKLLFVKAGFHDQVSSIYLPPLSLYYWAAIMFSCSVETFCRCASYWSGLLVKEPVLRLVLVHLGLESHEGRKPKRDYEAQDIVVVSHGTYNTKEFFVKRICISLIFTIRDHLIFYFPDSTTLRQISFVSFSLSRKSEKMPTAWTRKNGNCTWASVKKWGVQARGPRIFVFTRSIVVLDELNILTRKVSYQW